MSTDFCMETLLRGSSSNTSVTSLGSNADLHLIANALNTSPFTQSPSKVLETCNEKGTSTKGTKRKYSDEEESEVVVPSSKKRRVRTVYSPEQIRKLEDIFARTQYPDLLMRESIAEELGFDEKKIHTWFQNRRAKHRRIHGNPVYNSQQNLIPSLHCSSPNTPHTVAPSPLPSIPLSSPSLPHQYHYPVLASHGRIISSSPVQNASLPSSPNAIIGTSMRMSSPTESSLQVYLPLRRSLSPLVPSPDSSTKSNSPQSYSQATYQFGRSSLSPQQPLTFIQTDERHKPHDLTAMHSAVYYPGPGHHHQVMPPCQRNNPAALHLPKCNPLSSSLSKSSQSAPILTSFLRSTSATPTSLSHSTSYRNPFGKENTDFVYVPAPRKDCVSDLYFSFVN